MEIYVVKPGDTLSSVARTYGADTVLLAAWNGLMPPYRLAVGQRLGVFFPAETYRVRQGDTLYAVSRQFGVGVRSLLRCNPQLSGVPLLREGQLLVIRFSEQGTRPADLLGYAYPFFDAEILRRILPYADYLSPFSYGVGAEGDPVALEDAALLQLAREYDVSPLLHLSSLTESGTFSSERVRDFLQTPRLWAPLTEQVLALAEEKGFRGVDVDFEYVGGENAAAYASFLAYLRTPLKEKGLELFVALAPKTSRDQPGVLYEGHDYRALAESADGVLLMTYEWGYTYGPAMAVAPLPSVKRVLDFAVTEMSPEKILIGFPNYGYDWTLPYVAGQSKARSISNEYAVRLALSVGAEIRYDKTAEAPWFSYTDEAGKIHEVWFEDAASAKAKFALVPQYGFRGVGYWNFMRPFAVSFLILEEMFRLQAG